MMKKFNQSLSLKKFNQSLSLIKSMYLLSSDLLDAMQELERRNITDIDSAVWQKAFKPNVKRIDVLSKMLILF